MPGATVAREADFRAPMAWKVFMMPQTVPNSPMNGAVFAEVARKDRELVRRVISMSTPCRSARRTLSTTTSSEFPASFERLNSVTPSWATVYAGSRDPRPRDCTAPRGPGVVETVQAVGGLLSAAGVHPFTEHQGPTEYAHEEQDHEDRFGYQRGLGKEGKNAQIHNVTPWYV